MYCACTVCATCTDYPGSAHYAYTNKDIDRNMDKYIYSIEDSNGSTTDEQSDTHEHYWTDKHGNKHYYTHSHNDKDTGRAGHAAKDGGKRKGLDANSRNDPDYNGDK
jgi:hypothetical protein